MYKRQEWKRFGGSVDLIEKGIWETHAAHLNTEELKDIIDFALPILHGPYGEDGKIQGFLETLGIPYGGCGVLASAVCMDKQMFKDVLRHKGFPVVRSMCLTCQNEPDESVLDKIEGELGFPCFVKPANMGSSVGISKAADRHQLACALRLAASYDSRVVIEEFVQCRDCLLYTSKREVFDRDCPYKSLKAGIYLLSYLQLFPGRGFLIENPGQISFERGDVFSVSQFPVD